jgi:2-methylcitrate dehydratase
VTKFAPERAVRPDTLRLWRKVRTVEAPEWSARFTNPAPLDKDHGARVVVTYRDGRTFEDEIAVAYAHPRGARPFGREDYRRKFRRFADGLVARVETIRFLVAVDAPDVCGSDDLYGLAVETLPGRLDPSTPGLFDRGL